MFQRTRRRKDSPREADHPQLDDGPANGNRVPPEQGDFAVQTLTTGHRQLDLCAIAVKSKRRKRDTPRPRTRRGRITPPISPPSEQRTCHLRQRIAGALDETSGGLEATDIERIALLEPRVTERLDATRRLPWIGCALRPERRCNQQGRAHQRSDEQSAHRLSASDKESD